MQEPECRSRTEAARSAKFIRILNRLTDSSLAACGEKLWLV